MQAYFNDEFNFDNQWLHTKIHVPQGITPYYQILSGGTNQRFMMTSKDYIYYWGMIGYDYYECYVLYPPQKANEFSPIKPINSQDVEQFKRKDSQDYWQYWANFYAKHLTETPYNFLYQGDWWLFPLPTIDTKERYFGVNYLFYDVENQQQKHPLFSANAKNQSSISLEVPYIYRNYETTFHYKLSHQLIHDNEPLHELRWDDEVDILLYHPPHLPPVDDGRVKWWRKKVRENSCPPLLVWYQSQLQGYLLIDGHARLQAYLAENTVPDVLVITPIFKKSYPLDLDKRLNILKSLQNNLTHSKHPMPLDRVNEVLVQAFNDNVRFSAKGSAKPIHNLDEIWLKDIKSLWENKVIDEQTFVFLSKDNKF